MQNFYDSIVDEMKKGDESQVAEQYRTELKALGKSLISQFITRHPFFPRIHQRSHIYLRLHHPLISTHPKFIAHTYCSLNSIYVYTHLLPQLSILLLTHLLVMLSVTTGTTLTQLHTTTPPTA